MDDPVTGTGLCSDLSLYSTFNDVYRGYFTKGFPVRPSSARVLLS